MLRQIKIDINFLLETKSLSLSLSTDYSEGGTCSALSTQYYGREDHQECCYCCYLGMEAKRKNMGCRRSAVLGYPCQKSFSSCCSMDGMKNKYEQM